MSFTYPVYIPSIEKFIHFRELLNKHYVVVLKFLANADNNSSEKYLNQLIDELNDEITHDQLNKVDKLCVLLTIRIMSISPDLELTMTCDKTQQRYTGKIELINIIQMISDLQLVKTHVFDMKNGIKIHAGIPSNLCYNKTIDLLDLLTDVICGITVKDNYFPMSDMSVTQKSDIIDHVHGLNFNSILKIARESQQSFSDLIIFEDKNPHDEQAQVNEYKLGLYDNTMFDLIKLCYSSNLNNYYMSMYTLCNTMGFTADYIQNITPIESNIYIGQQQQEIKRQSDEQKKSNPTLGGGLPSGF